MFCSLEVVKACEGRRRTFHYSDGLQSRSLAKALRRACERHAKLLQTLSTSPPNLNSGLNSHVLLKGKSRVSCDFFKIVTCKLRVSHV